MGTTLTLTIPTDEKLHKAFRARALLQGKTVPDLVQEILSEALQERPLGERIGHLRGQLHLQQDSDPWREHLRKSNFRP